jgi:hypothetical protein
MDLYLIFYIFLTIVTGLGVSNYLYKSGRFLSALLFFVGAILVFVFYGTRWFEGASALKKTLDWPPVVNQCPDYLTYYGRVKADGTRQRTCIDTLGVSKKSSVLQPWGNNTMGPSNPANDAFYFNLDVAASNDTERKTALCQAAIQAGVTWEGVTDGEVCTFPGAMGTATGGTGGTASLPKCAP